MPNPSNLDDFARLADRIGAGNSDPTADPLADLKAAQRLVSGACGFAANFIVMGRLAGDAFEANAKVLESYNKLHIQSGTLAPATAFRT